MTGEKWREIAWNGICLEVPKTWDIANLGTKHLVLARYDEPVLEIKWEAVAKAVAIDKEFERLSRQFRRRQAIRLKRVPLPERWDSALSGFDVVGLSWEKNPSGDKGVLAFCPVCKTLSVIHFFGASVLKGHDFEPVASRILKSISDHSETGSVSYRLYDLKAEIPIGFTLMSYLFFPGAFELHFADGPQKLSLYRWSPASVLLGKTGLSGFAADFLRTQPHFITPIDSFRHPAVQWQPACSESTCSIRRFGSFRKPKVQWARIWHEAAENRILAVQGKDMDLSSMAILNQICEAYETISQSPAS
jgi:hypothetical protein